MKDATEKVVFVIYGLLGSIIGLLFFVFALDGSNFIFTGRESARWNGTVALILCCALGGGWGLVAYMLKDRALTESKSWFFQDPATALLFSKRLMIIATSIASAYFVWQVARST